MTQKRDLTKMPLKLLGNRVYRSYQGGQLIEEWQGVPGAKDGMQPEEWVASPVEARNSTVIPGEGLSMVDINGMQTRLIDLIHSDPEHYLGKDHVAEFGTEMGVLTKVLDASVRLSIQVHPTKTYSRNYFGSEYGKTEAWYIIGGRDVNGEKPYVLAGFKPGITRDQWKQYFEEQDIDAMINALHRYDVKPGDVVLIEGGLPHAIGSGCFLVEIQEPTDFTMRVEKTAFDGSILPDKLCHQGLGFDLMLDCFTYDELSYQDTYQKCFKTPEILLESDGNQLISLISRKDTLCFAMNKISVNTKISVDDRSFKACIVLAGEGDLQTTDDIVAIRQGDIYFLPAGLGEVIFTNSGDGLLECILCYPPSLA